MTTTTTPECHNCGADDTELRRTDGYNGDRCNLCELCWEAGQDDPFSEGELVRADGHQPCDAAVYTAGEYAGAPIWPHYYAVVTFGSPTFKGQQVLDETIRESWPRVTSSTKWEGRMVFKFRGAAEDYAEQIKGMGSCTYASVVEGSLDFVLDADISDGS